MPRMGYSIAAAAAFSLLVGAAAMVALADTKKGTAMTQVAPQPVTMIVREQMPFGYREASRQAVIVDGEGAELMRYERADGRNAGIGGEHFSLVVGANGRVKGFARIDLDLVGGELPSREEVQEIAMAFLQRAAPDLLPVLEISWIEPHDEPLRVMRDGRTENLTLTGMKVKMRNTTDGRWFWVIVGADRNIMVFERDIVWITFPGHRKTEKWLHDSWFSENSDLVSAAHKRTEISVGIQSINSAKPAIPGISYGTVIEKGASIVLLSGHVPMLEDGSIAVGSLENQLDLVFRNIGETLKAAGCSFLNVARITIYVRDYDPRYLPIIRAVRDRYVNPERPPASALIGVASLFHPDVLVEVDAIAAISASADVSIEK